VGLQLLRLRYVFSQLSLVHSWGWLSPGGGAIRRSRHRNSVKGTRTQNDRTITESVTPEASDANPGGQGLSEYEAANASVDSDLQFANRHFRKASGIGKTVDIL
jgi:hypothetical protein